MHATAYVLTHGLNGVLIHLFSSILVRWCVALGSYSGERKPPMYGDYEAQRHWQEVTYNLPVAEWYTNSSLNDLQYWGLDYPPLTAYHSWLCGYMASLIDNQWVELDTSRGMEGYSHKLFMRYTVLFGDCLILFPAIILCYRSSQQKTLNQKNVSSSALLTLFYPGLILIDHGHFQYNNISLGLFILTVIAFDKKMFLLGSVFFCLSLNYKQMELFHSLPVFFFLLGVALKKRNWIKSIFMLGMLGITVIVSFGILWMPYLSSTDSMLQVLNRLFPVDRGLYEDKVANLWCSISPVLKIREIMSKDTILKLCAGTTLFVTLPSCLHLLKSPTSATLRLSLVYVSLVFFLFSYQVHEKSILIPAISACLLYDVVPPFLVTWFLHVTVLSLSPLLYKDKLAMQQITVTILFLILSSLYHSFGKKSILPFVRRINFIKKNWHNHAANFLLAAFWASILTSVFLFILPFIYKPTARFPDLIPVVNSVFCCVLFIFFAVVFLYLQLTFPFDVQTKKVN
ncbi:dolichyl pyrophosphate Man9GlcNAc2 alpha-1,3-glucosyltransferase-like [Clavelina lepadiformis]|uniref:dolichyl pyrophosphate Man9GlcNAc2 alpha-1,3-glucosyltransferase-like n=1 Tax=Clavelina lepadiformis TaxID=159417 RepID=UPI0040437029